MTSVEIPSSVTEIGEGAFHQCRNLASINIPSSVTEIGEGAFISCYKLIPELLIYNNGTKCFGWIGDSLKCVEVVIPEGVKSIDRNAFFGCKNLAKVFIPSSVTEIGSEAFYNCSSLTSIEIPSSVTEIGSRAFAYCDTLDITIDNNEYSVNVGHDAFEDVHSVSFKGVIEANGIRFHLLTDSTLIVDTIKTNASVVIIPSEVFSNGKRYDVTEIQNCAALGKAYLEIVEIPSSVTHIGGGAFYECINLNVIIDNSKDNVEVGNNAFYGVKSVKWLKEKDEDPSVADASAYAPLKFEITSDSTVELTRGENWDSYRNLDSVNIPAKVKIDGKAYNVTGISNWVFYDCDSLKNIIIPESVTSIGSGAFTGCQGLTSIEIPASVTSIADSAFASCTGLKTIVIPESVTSIEHQTFWECSSLESIIIPESITEIEERTFHGCSSLTTVVIPKSINKISYGLFENCSNLTSIVIPESITEIEPGAFYGCENLDIVIENSEENVKVGSRAFDGVKSVTWKKDMDSSSVADTSAYAPLRFKITSDSTVELTRGYYYDLDSVNIPSKVKIDGKVYSVTSIDSYAFYDCSSLTSIDIPSTVTSIGEGAFYNCSKLKPELLVYDNGTKCYGWIGNKDSCISVVIPETVITIADSAFLNCYNLTDINIPESVTKIGGWAFCNCSSLTSIDIPSSVTEIGSYAFSGCSSLTSIDIPSSVTEIGEYAFSGCSKLNPEVLIFDNGTKCYGWIGDRDSCISVVIPSSVTSIGSYAFAYCSSLTSIEIPSSVTSIGSSAFYWCDNLDIVIDNSKENVKFYRKRYDWNQDMYIVEETTMEESYAFNGVKSVTWKE